MNNPQGSYFDEGFIQELEITRQARNYNQWIWERIRPFVKEKVLEIGCGIGTFTRMLLETGADVTAIDQDERCISLARQTLSEAPNLSLHTLPAERIRELNKAFDTIIMLNVLEHIKDDSNLMKELADFVKGHVVIFVPAFPMLFGKTDSLVGHYRRYSRRYLLSVMESAGLEVVSCNYFNSLGFFALFVMNKILRQEKNTAKKVRFYDRFIVPILRVVENPIAPPFGQSLLLVAKSS